MKHYSKTRKNRGFTLVETVIAMGIITIMATAFLAAFGPAVQGIRKAISVREANRLASSLEAELTVLRPDEVTSDSFTTAFEKAFTWIEDSGSSSKDDMVLIYQYRGDPSSVREDGTLAPLTNPTGDEIPGEGFVVQSVVRRLGDEETQEELQPRVVEGRVFFARMTQLVFNDEVLEIAGENGAPGGVGQIVDPTPDESGDRDTVTGFEDYPDALLSINVEFFVMRSSLFSYISNTFDIENPGKPVFTRSMGVRR